MNVGTIVAEYNPFHSGHLYQIEEAKKSLNIDYLIVIMSTSFVQRGEPAILDKYTRARIAIEYGVDLVIELPSYFSLQSAEYFAFGAIEILKEMGIVDYLIFGSESSLSDLLALKDIIDNNRQAYDAGVKESLDLGYSYSTSLRNSLKSLGFNRSIGSNDILGLEYLKNLSDSNIEAFSIRRQGDDYLASHRNSTFASATYIRQEFNKGKLENIKDTMPELSYKYLLSILNNKKIHSLNDYYSAFYYKALIEKASFKDIVGYEDGFENLFTKNLLITDNIMELISLSTSRRYSKSRLARFILAYLLDLKRIEGIKNHLYVRPLAIKTESLDLLGLISQKSKIPLISKFNDFYRKKTNPILDLEIKTSNLYNINNKHYNSDFTSPIIKI